MRTTIRAAVLRPDGVEHGRDLRRGGGDPVAQLIAPPRTYLSWHGRPNGFAVWQFGEDLGEADVVAADRNETTRVSAAIESSCGGFVPAYVDCGVVISAVSAPLQDASFRDTPSCAEASRA